MPVMVCIMVASVCMPAIAQPETAAAESPPGIESTTLEARSLGAANLPAKAIRAATLAVGAYPIAYLYTNFGFDLGAYLASGRDARYAPWPFRGTDAVQPDTEERTLRILVAAGLSLALGIIDAMIIH